MKPEAIHDRVRADHAAIRETLGELESTLEQARRGDAVSLRRVRERGLHLNEQLARHLDLEDRHLVPWVRETLGEDEAVAIEEEHREQRLLFEYVLGRLEHASRPSRLVIQELRTFLALLREDMEGEERAVLSGRVDEL